MQKIRFICWVVIFLTGCASPKGLVVFKNINRPLQTIQQSIIQSFPGEPDKVLQGGRLLISQPFVIKDGQIELAQDQRVRYYVKVFIHGFQRPYTINVKGIEQRLTKHGFKDVKLNDWIAKGMAQMIYSDLNKSRKHRNIIDDFRPF